MLRPVTRGNDLIKHHLFSARFLLFWVQKDLCNGEQLANDAGQLRGVNQKANLPAAPELDDTSKS
jgi:hypothetical protein